MKKLVSISLLLMITGCGKFTEMADRQFGDQHFKSSIALIELHKTRYGEYPDSLDDLKFIGDWDGIFLSRVEYKKLPNGYKLDLVSGWIGMPEGLTYPADFWKGLGLKISNLKNNRAAR
jgi:hypothetical protein